MIQLASILPPVMRDFGLRKKAAQLRHHQQNQNQQKSLQVEKKEDGQDGHDEQKYDDEAAAVVAVAPTAEVQVKSADVVADASANSASFQPARVYLTFKDLGYSVPVATSSSSSNNNSSASASTPSRSAVPPTSLSSPSSPSTVSPKSEYAEETKESGEVVREKMILNKVFGVAGPGRMVALVRLNVPVVQLTSRSQDFHFECAGFFQS